MISLLRVLLVLLAAAACSGQDVVAVNNWVVSPSESEEMPNKQHICNAIGIESGAVFVTGYYEDGDASKAFLARLTGSTISVYKQLESEASPTDPDVALGKEGEGIDLAIDSGASSVYTLVSGNSGNSVQTFLVKSSGIAETNVIKEEMDAQGTAVTLRGEGRGVLVAGNALADGFGSADEPLDQGWYIALYGVEELEYVDGVSLADDDIQDDIQDVIDIVYDATIDQAYVLCSSSNNEGVRVLIAAVLVSLPGAADRDQKEQLTLEWMLPLPKTSAGDAFPVAISVGLDQTVVAIYHYSDENSALDARYAKVGSAGVLLGVLAETDSDSREVTPLNVNRSQVGVGVDSTRRRRVQALVQAVNNSPCQESRTTGLTDSPFGISAVGRQVNELADGRAVQLYLSIQEQYASPESEVVDCLDAVGEENGAEALRFIDSDYTAIEIEEDNVLDEKWVLVLEKPADGSNGIQWTELEYNLAEPNTTRINVLNITCPLEFEQAVGNGTCSRVRDGIRQIVQDATETTSLEDVLIVQGRREDDVDCRTGDLDRELVLQCYDCEDEEGDQKKADETIEDIQLVFKEGRIDESLDVKLRLRDCEKSSPQSAMPEPTPTPITGEDEPTPVPEGGLSTGSIAGIAVGCAVMAIIVGVVAALVIVRRRGKGAYDPAYGYETRSHSPPLAAARGRSRGSCGSRRGAVC